MRKYNILFIVLISFVLIGCQKKGKKRLEKTSTKSANTKQLEDISTGSIDAKELKKTDVMPHIEAVIPKGRSVIYCSTIQLAWNELINEVIRKDIHIDDGPDWVINLNKQIGSKNDISERYYVAKAGFVYDGIVEKINGELEARFNKSYEPSIPVTDSGIIAYAYLFKNFSFSQEFEPNQYLNFNKEKGVKAFGLTAEYNPQSENLNTSEYFLYDYKNDDDFILQLQFKNSDEEIYLAKVNPGKSLYETYQKATKRINSDTRSDLKADDKIKIPVLEYKIEKGFDELIGKRFTDSKNDPYFFTMVRQMIRFEMNEKGVVLESEAEAIAEAVEEPEFENVPKLLYFDKPYLIILREKNAENPYFLMWVNNSELMKDY